MPQAQKEYGYTPIKITVIFTAFVTLYIGLTVTYFDIKKQELLQVMPASKLIGSVPSEQQEQETDPAKPFQPSSAQAQISSDETIESLEVSEKVKKSKDLIPWNLLLVNQDNHIADNFNPKLTTLYNGLKVDSRAIGQLKALLKDAHNAGYPVKVCSAYRSAGKQRELYEDKISRLMEQGFDRSQAENEAAKEVAPPKTSEHSLGLAVDIVSIKYQTLDEEQGDRPEMKWVKEHCADYGFILRYPPNKSNITHVIYEPWHFRYVGINAAREIMERGITLEEYLQENFEF
ncbi:MAG: M15 family metallopeptidase [Oscillospiraceae bacterium]|jgi:D-alanyl-D-alanine carboxypeptidase|nr:M15 family metallopeptidase [Oscillospiraceae bacterium]